VKQTSEVLRTHVSYNTDIFHDASTYTSSALPPSAEVKKRMALYLHLLIHLHGVVLNEVQGQLYSITPSIQRICDKTKLFSIVLSVIKKQIDFVLHFREGRLKVIEINFGTLKYMIMLPCKQKTKS
jgi:hypothetical protein